MNCHFPVELKITSRLLFKLARGIGHVETTTPIANRQAVREDVLAEPHRHCGIERLHKPIAKDIPGNDVGMTRTKDQIAVRVDPGPVKRHETAFISERVEIVREPVVKVFTAQMARTGDDIRRQRSKPRSRE